MREHACLLAQLDQSDRLRQTAVQFRRVVAAQRPGQDTEKIERDAAR